MNKEKIKMLLQLRKFVIDQHNKLSDRQSQMSMVKEQDMAAVFSSIIKSIEDVVKDDVTFK